MQAGPDSLSQVKILSQVQPKTSINLQTLQTLLHPAIVKEIPIILVLLAWPKIAMGSQKTPKRKMCTLRREFCYKIYK